MDHSTSMYGQTGLEGSLQQMKLQDCTHFLRTGNCAFGSKCRFNHPMAEKPQLALPNDNTDELPERPGQVECQFFMKTGTCKFGSACWYHHPRPKDGSGGGGQVQLNFLGLPLRPGEKECAYYVQTGSCKYGVTCRFHHPQPTTAESVVQPPNSSTYAPSEVPSPAPVLCQDGVPTRSVPRAPYIPLATGMQRPFVPVLVPSPQPVPNGLAPFRQQGQVGLMSYIDSRGPQATPQEISYGHCQGNLATHTGVNGLDSSLPKSTTAFLQGQATFPERIGQPDCHHYMKTGDCKFGMSCKYHHPKDRAISLPAGLNPMGLPLRPGKPSCAYYVKHGICKFGPVCKFDHPMRAIHSSPPHSPSLSSLNEIPVAPFVPESSSLSPVSKSPERLHDATSNDVPESTSAHMPSVEA